MNKRGVSSIIATALLIGLVVVLSTIVFLWAKGFVTEQIEKFGTPIERQCDNIDLSTSYLTKQIDEDKEVKIYSFAISNNGNVPVYGIAIGMKKGGRTEIKTFENLQIKAGDTIRNDFDLSEYSDFEFNELIIYPILLGQVVGKNENKMQTCLNNGITFEV